MVTKSEIIALLRTNDRAIARALMVLADRQTADEQASESTRYDNGRGFRPCHARMGTSMAKFFRARGYLSPKQVAYWRAAMKTGQMRIEIYAGQLMDAAKVKADARLRLLRLRPSRVANTVSINLLPTWSRSMVSGSSPLTPTLVAMLAT
jgi:hypothetical protein